MSSLAKFWMTYLGHREVFGQSLSLNEVCAGFRQFAPNLLHLFFSRVDIVNARLDLAERLEYQRTLAGDFISVSDRVLVMEAINRLNPPGRPKPHTWLLTPQHLWVAQRLLLSNPGMGTRRLESEDDRHLLGRLFLGLSDHLEFPEVSGPAFEAAHASRVKPALLSMVVRNYLLNAENHFDHDLVRWHSLIHDIPRRLSAHPSYFDFQETIEEVVGISYLDYLAIAFAIALRWYVIDLDVLKRTSPVLFRNAHFPTDRFDADKVEKVLSYLSDRPPMHRTPPSEQPFNPYEFLAFRKKPLLQLLEGEYIPVAFKLLLAKITTGLLHTAVSQLTGSKAKRARIFLGHVFEEYGRDVLSRIFPAASGRLLHKHYKSSKGEKEAADAIVLYEDSAIVLDFKTSSPTAEVYASGDLTEFARKADDCLLDGYRKCLRVIDDVVTGKTLTVMPELAGVRKFYPVVVSLISYPQDHLTNEQYEQLAGVTSAQPNAMPLVFMSIDDLENIEELTKHGHTLKQLLEMKLQQPNLPMRNLLYDNFQVLREGAKDFMLSQYHELARKLWAQLGVTKQPD